MERAGNRAWGQATVGRVVTGACVALLLAVGGVTNPAMAAEDLVVATTSGEVLGAEIGSVRRWAGVPYAAPPVGDLRWRPPVPAPPWSGVLDAGSFREPCMQLIGPDQVEGSEDCLYLNVFAPAGSGASSGLPVIVHLHGGSNWGFRPYENADVFVDRGVVVVTVGYRLGVFGFVGHPGLSAEDGGSSGEYGVLDQLAALQWVQDNIAGFGGDPSNVTLAGESAGSFDALAMLASPLGQGLFARAALQTTADAALDSSGTIADAERLGLDVAEAVGCGAASDTVDCLRAQPAPALVTAACCQDVQPWVGGQVLPRSPLDLIAALPSPPPMLLGSNREEAALTFGFGDFVLGLRRYGTDFYVRDTNWVAGPPSGRIVRALYPLTAFDAPVWAGVAAVTDAVYTCPVRRLARAVRAPVFRYVYAHVYDNSDFFAAFRATHFLDDPILWHDPGLLVGFGQQDYVFSGAEEGLSATMASYWANFATTGDPNGPGLPLWPQHQSGDEQLLVLDDVVAASRDHQAAQCDVLDTVPAVLPPPGSYVPPVRFGAPHGSSSGRPAANG